MAITFERTEDGVCRLTVDGEMTIYTAQELKDALLAPLAEGGNVELDLGAVSEIDSAGLQLLILLKSETRAQGKLLSITSHSPAVLDILDLCNLEGFFGDALLIPVE